MMNQASKFGPIAVLGILKRLNDLDFTNGPHIIPEIAIQRSGLFCNISKSMRDQRLIFDQVAVFGHDKRMIGLDCDFIAHINDKIEKTGLPTVPS